MKRTLVLAQLASAIGDGVFLTCSALYFTRIVGLQATEVGLALTLGWAAGILTGVPLGHLADRSGPRRVAVTLAFTTAASISSFPFLRSFPAFLAAAVTYAVAQTGLSAARQALLAGLVGPPQRTQVRAFLQAVLNAGLAIGASAGGLALYVNTRAAYFAVFTLDAVAFVAAGFILSRLPTVEAANTEPTLGVLRDKPYAVITALNAVMMLYMPLLSVAIPLWIVLRTPAPGWMVSSLLILNTLSVMLFQVRVARKVTGLRRAAILVQRSGAVMLISCGVFALTAFSGSAWKAATLLVLAATLQVVGEMMLAAGAWEISFNLAPPDKHGRYQALFGTGTTIARMAGPLLLISLVIGLGAPGWLIAGALFATAGAAMRPAIAWAAKNR